MSKSSSPPSASKEFNPAPNDRLVIRGQTYQVMPHPAVPTFAFGQEGRKAFVYQVFGGANGGLSALKKFKPAFRVPELVEVCDALARFAQWPGLEVCERQCLHSGAHDDALDRFPDLEFAVLMPWISGSTWYDMIIGERPLNRLAALTFANAAAQVFAALEEAGLAHCDISAANIIINYNSVTQSATAHLIDIEDLYAPGFSPPAALPAGSDGYAHKTALDGLWGPAADRFAGAVLIVEMVAWHVPEIRKRADEEHYFGISELQQDSLRYQLMRSVLQDHDPCLTELFDHAWFSETLEDCPPLKEWHEVIKDVYHRERLATVVSDWAPITVPANMPDAAPRPFVQPEPAEAPEQPAPKPESELEAQPVSVRSEPAEPVVLPAPERKPLTLPSPPAPQPAPRPIVAPSQDGPVAEWRPLDLSSAMSLSPGSDFSPSSPAREIMPTSVEETTPARDDVSEIHEPVSEPEPFFPPDDDVDKQVADDVVTGESTFENEEITPQSEFPPSEVEGDGQPLSALSKPSLDLTHIDRRNRPFLVWTESYGATCYLLQEADNPGFQSPKEFEIKAKETRWHPRWGRSGRLYYRIRALTENEASPWSDVLSIRIG